MSDETHPLRYAIGGLKQDKLKKACNSCVHLFPSESIPEVSGDIARLQEEMKGFKEKVRKGFKKIEIKIES